ncbi:MAG: hypothetical protein RTU63_10860 [Candidatus Thorarchaeota archaeon]
MTENIEQSGNDEPVENYQGLFAIGITFIGVGAALMSTNPGMVALLVMGIIFMAISFNKRKK